MYGGRQESSPSAHNKMDSSVMCWILTNLCSVNKFIVLRMCCCLSLCALTFWHAFLLRLVLCAALASLLPLCIIVFPARFNLLVTLLDITTSVLFFKPHMRFCALVCLSAFPLSIACGLFAPLLACTFCDRCWGLGLSLKGSGGVLRAKLCTPAVLVYAT